jgi:hypothetical protein
MYSRRLPGHCAKCLASDSLPRDVYNVVAKGSRRVPGHSAKCLAPNRMPDILRDVVGGGLENVGKKLHKTSR